MRHETAAAAFTYRTLGECLNRCTQREKRREGGGGGEFISVRDATRRAKMKADGRWCGGGHRDSGASVFNEPAQYSRFSAEGEGDVSFDVRGGGVNEAGPFLVARIDICVFAGETREER